MGDGNAFPMDEEVEDYAGRKRTFVVTCREGPFGFTLIAREKNSRQTAYEFAAFSEKSPNAALGRLRRKMRRGLATRHITETNLGYSMLHDKLSGRISSDRDGRVVIVIDGIPLSVDEFGSILITHEGWNFEMTIIDPCE